MCGGKKYRQLSESAFKLSDDQINAVIASSGELSHTYVSSFVSVAGMCVR